MTELINSGKTTFKVEVPYKLFETGQKGEKPLIVYLHGFGQNISRFQEEVGEMQRLRAYHLFLQGPYPLYDRSRKERVENWGRAWYLYDGRQAQFVKSLEIASEFIQGVIDNLLAHIEVNRIAVLGYSMGGYLAGYFALSRWKHVNEAIVIGGRIKTEVFEGREHHYDHLHMLALHGSEDRSVEAEPQQKSVRKLEKWGAQVDFKMVEAGHNLNSDYIAECMTWLKKLGYEEL